MVKNIAIVTDSNSGITQKEAGELGIHVLPMPFTIDGQEYFEDITLSQEEFYQKLEADADIATSQPSPASVMNLWDELLKTHDAVVHIPMSSGLSGSCQTAIMLAEDYDGRVQVVNNQRISVTQRQSVLEAKELAEKGKTAEEIKEILEQVKLESSIYITVATLKYLKKGGRITPAAAALGTILRIKPVLTIQGEKLDAFSKVRTVSQAKAVMMNAIKKDIDTRFGGVENHKVRLQVAHTNNEEAALAFIEEIKEAFPGYEVDMAPLSLSVACHIGAGSLAFATTKILEV